MNLGLPAAILCAATAAGLALLAVASVIETGMRRLVLGRAEEVRGLSAAGQRRLIELGRRIERLSNAGSDPWRERDYGLLASVSVVTAIAGSFLFGVGGGVAGIVGGPILLRSAVRLRHRRRVAAIDRGASSLALGLAGSLAAGRSLSGSLDAVVGAVDGPLGYEIDRVVDQLSVGVRIDRALAELAIRCRSRRVATIVSAIELQRRHGGNMAELLRQFARSFEQQDRAGAAAVTATAGARLTSWIVIAIPPLAGAGYELASPGSISGVLRVAPAAVLLVVAVALDCLGAWLIHRIVGPRSV